MNLHDNELWRCAQHEVLGSSMLSLKNHEAKDHDGRAFATRRVPSVEAPHFISWTLSAWGDITAKVDCKATGYEPCRVTCAEPDCVEHTDEDGHVLKRYSTCIMTEWIENDGAAELYGGPDRPLVSDEIVFLWKDDHPIWLYASDRNRIVES